MSPGHVASAGGVSGICSPPERVAGGDCPAVWPLGVWAACVEGQCLGALLLGWLDPTLLPASSFLT